MTAEGEIAYWKSITALVEFNLEKRKNAVLNKNTKTQTTESHKRKVIMKDEKHHVNYPHKNRKLNDNLSVEKYHKYHWNKNRTQATNNKKKFNN